jgi:sugar lactone lactonase YvrE
MMTAILTTMRRGALAPLVALFAALLVSCGGIESPNGDTGGGPAPTLLALNGGGTATAGAGAVPLSATHTGSGTVAWQLAAGSPGSLSASSGDSVSYLPPPAGAVTSPTTVTITATVDGVSKSTTVTLNPTPGGVYLVAGTVNGFGNVDGTGSAARFTMYFNYAGVAVDANGNIFTTDLSSGILRKITPQGVVTTYAGQFQANQSVDGPLASASFSSPTALAFDASGNLYVGDSIRIRRITPAGTVSTIATLASAGQIHSLAIAANGNIYAAGYSAIYVVSATGSVAPLAGAGSGNFVDGPIGFTDLGGMALDAAGNLIVADSGHKIVRQVTPNGAVTTLAGADGVAGDTDGPGSSARFRRPAGLAIAPDGRIFVSDAQSDLVRVITRSGTSATVATFAGHNTGRNPGTSYLPASSVDGSVGTAQFAFPYSLSFNPSGELIVSDGSAIRKVSASGAVSTLAGVPVNFQATDGSGGNAVFDFSSYYGGGLWSDAGGTLYLAEAQSNTVRRITPAGAVTTITGSLYVAGSADGAASAARFLNPRGITGDANGNLYVSDNGNRTIRRIASNGTVTTLAGSVGVRGNADGTGSAATFNTLDGMVLDGAGNLFVIDNQNNTVAIRRVTPAGVVTTFARIPSEYAEALAIDTAGNLYLGGFNQAVLYKISPSGSVTVLAGSPNTYGTADGTGSAARFLGIGGVTVDPAGNVYAMDTSAGTIRKITPAGVVTTVAGTPGRLGPTQASAALPGVLPGSWSIRWVGPNTLAVMGDNGIFKVILP